MGRLGRLGLEPAVRNERSRPGELVHKPALVGTEIHEQVTVTLDKLWR